MILLDTTTIKTSHIVTLSPHNGKLPHFYYKLPHLIFSDVFSISIFPQKIPEQCINKHLSYVIFGIGVLIDTIVSEL